MIFIQRDLICQQLATLFKHSRLVSICGLGGMGKTVLARQFSQATTEPVLWIDLETSDHLESAVLSALPNGELIHLTGLIVLDNCEHLVDQAVWINTLLETAPDVKVLVTSRRPLNLQAEALFLLEGLAYDGIHSPAARLLIERGKRVFPQLDPQIHRQAIERVCKLTEGMPLALELIAARFKTLLPDDLMHIVEQTPDALRSSTQDRKARQRGIVPIFDESWGALSEESRQLLRMLAVFQGTFTAQAINGHLEVLETLVTQSLVQREVTGYRLHPLIKQIVLQRTPADELHTLEAQHAHYFLMWLAAQTPHLQGAAQHKVLDAISAAYPNIQKAWLTACRDHAEDLLIGAALPMSLFVMMRHRIDGLSLFDRALTAVTDGSMGWARLVVAWLLARQWHQQIDAHHDQAQVKSALHIAEANEDRQLQGLCWRCLGHIAYLSGDVDAARNAWDRALVCFDDAPYERLQLLRLLGHTYISEKDATAARRDYQHSYDLAIKQGDREGQAGALMGLGAVAELDGVLAQAEAYVQQALTIQVDLGNWGRYLYSANHLLWLLLCQGAIDRARQMADTVRQQIHHLPVTHLAGMLARLSIVTGAYSEAAERLCDVDPLHRKYDLWLMIALGQKDNSAAHKYLIATIQETSRNPTPTRMLTCLMAAALLEGNAIWGGVVERHAGVFWLRHADLWDHMPTDNSDETLETAFAGILAHYRLDPDTPLLTAREADVLRALAQGLQNKEIALTLKIRPGTVKQHINNIYRKLGVSNRVEALNHERVRALLYPPL